MKENSILRHEGELDPAGGTGLDVVEGLDDGCGATYGDQDAATLLGWAKELGCNYVMPGAASLSFAPGATAGNSTTITVTPSGGFTGSVTLTAAVTAPGSGALAVPKRPGSRGYETGGVALAGLLLLVIPARRITPASKARRVPDMRGLRALLGLLAWLAALSGGVTGCGGGGNSGGMVSSNPGTTAGNYTITVTARAGTAMAQTTVTVTVN